MYYIIISIDWLPLRWKGIFDLYVCSTHLLGHIKVGIFLRGIIVQFEWGVARWLCYFCGAVSENNKLVQNNSNRSTNFTRRCYTVENKLYCKRIRCNKLKQLYAQVLRKNECRFTSCIRIIDSLTASSIIQAPYVSISFCLHHSFIQLFVIIIYIIIRLFFEYIFIQTLD